SGGTAYLLDPDPRRVNAGMADLEPVPADDADLLRALVQRHHAETGSPVAARLLTDWDAALPRFAKVMPHDYKRVQEAARRAAPSARAWTSTRPSWPPRTAEGDVMADPKGFLTTPRVTPARRPVSVRISDWREVYTEFGSARLELQAGRCMDCGIPFCHQGCPLG